MHEICGMQHRQYCINVFLFSESRNVFFQNTQKYIWFFCLSFSLSLVVFVKMYEYFLFTPSILQSIFFLSIRDFFVHSFALFLCSFDAFFVIRCKVFIVASLFSWFKIKQLRNVKIESTHSKVKRTKFYFCLVFLFLVCFVLGYSACFFYYVFSLAF